jgi:hypothetical protein
VKKISNTTVDKRMVNTIQEKKRAWIKDMENDYYNALIGAVKGVIKLQKSSGPFKGATEGFASEIKFIDDLLRTYIPLSEHEFTYEWVIRNKHRLKPIDIKPLSIHGFFTNHRIREAYEFIRKKLALISWKNSGYNKSFGLELAQCKALERYQESLKNLDLTNGKLSDDEAEKIVSIFDDTDLTQVIDDGEIKNFKKIELCLVKQHFLNDKGEWVKHKGMMVAFILILYELKILQQIIDEKRTYNSTLRKYRDWFATRYNTKISNQFKYTNRKSLLKQYKTEFSFLNFLNGWDNIGSKVI